MPLFDELAARRRSETLKALGHPIRLRIVDLLNSRAHNVGEIAGLLVVDSAIVSQQLKILRMSGLVQASRRDGHSYYSLAMPQLRNLLECLKSCEH